MKMVEVKTAELIGSALDLAVAHVESVPLKFSEAAGFWRRADCPDIEEWRPSTDWAQGGPLIDRYRVSIIYSDEQCDPCAWTDHTNAWHGETPLIAACRAIVAAKLGDVVSVPAELINQ